MGSEATTYTFNNIRLLSDEFCKFFAIRAAISDTKFTPTNDIDLFHHQFILFTLEYSSFCSQVYGTFLDHTPCLPGQDMSVYKTYYRQYFEVYTQAFGDPCPQLLPDLAINPEAHCDCGSAGC